MRLIAGERLRLTDEDKYALAVSGRIEVYAVTKDKDSFRQMFLLELAVGEAAFPTLDDLEQVETLLYAVEDAEVELISFEMPPPEKIKALMQDWFCHLADGIPYLRMMADRGDDVLAQWVDRSVLGTAESREEILDGFRRNEEILSALVGVYFDSRDDLLEQRMEVRAKYQSRLMDEALGHLLRQDVMHSEAAPIGSKNLEEVTGIVRQVAHHFGMPVDNIKLAPELSRKLDQVGLLRRLIQKGGMQMRLVTLERGWYRKDSGVMIGWYSAASGKKRRLIAILPEAPGRYIICTGDNNGGIPVTEDTASHIEPSALACYAGLAARPLSLRDLFRFMLRHSWQTDRRFLILVSILAGLIPLVTPIITETIFQDIIPILDRRGLATVTQVSVVSSFTLAAFSLCRALAMLRITTGLDMAVETALWGRLLALPTQFFRRFTSGELASRMMGLESAKTLLSGSFVETVMGFVFSFWSLLLMCYYSLKLTALALVIWAIYLVLQIAIFRNVKRIQRNLVTAKNKTAGIVQQIFAGLAKFRIQGSETQAYYLWSKFFGEEWGWNLKLRWQNNYSTILTDVQPLLLALVLYYVAYTDSAKAILDGKLEDVISSATFMAFSAAYTGYNTMLAKAVPLASQIFSLQPLLENLQPILAEQPEGADDRVDAGVLSGAIEVSHLSFSYGEGAPEILHDLSFRVAAGENIAIVGKSGCGKSTLLRLLLGFEQPKMGSVLFDGQDMADLNPTSVRSQMGIVLQNGQLMTGDIFTNIVGQSALTIKDAWAAAEAAGIADDIRQMPMGMQTVISEGSGNISGGQRQRLLIARALAAKPAIVIFDEATSALDNRAQAIVTESLNRLKATRLVVAHRLSTIRECNRILVLEQGRIAESGTFDELVKKDGIFAKLVKRQVV
ncbi:NHLP bacteriocin export ABC transporter permease/ATPase subunit [Selenomonas sp. AB3002]|uniref:NHLP bacteriocin export ABC transporter permease/ATPase subunit n=1 Tax=Selenomonas sp. AB3002 TaxID=1392502 RepID=UPI00068F372F